MLGECWTIFSDAGPALAQFWMDVTCLLGYVSVSNWTIYKSAGLCITMATTKLNANVCNKSFTSFAHVFPPIFIYIFSTSYNKLLASYDQEALTTLTSIQHTSFYNV